jgi:integrase
MRADFIEREFLRLILDVMQRDNALAVRVSLETGLRIGDVLALTEDKLSPGGALETVCQKTGKPFSGQVSERTAADLRANACGGWLFPSPRNVSKHKSRQAVWKDIKNAARKCGVKVNVTPHTARKVHGVETFRKKGLNEVQRELQHDRIQTSLLYAFADALTGERHQKPPQAADSHAAEEFLAELIKNLGGACAVYDAIMAALDERGCE